MALPAPFGKYELLERIATGGMAEVFLARSFGVAGFEKRLVIKCIRPELEEDPRLVQMFINEAKIGVHLNHPNVVQVYELGRVNGRHYIAMEHLHGRDLTRVVKTLRTRGDHVPLPVAVEIVAEVCRGLGYAHSRTDRGGAQAGVVHQDVSPHNVIVTFAGEVKLVDFGIARVMNTASGASSDRSRPGGGKYAYMSPEQARGEPLEPRSDLFSAGIVLWELLVGHRLYRDSDPAEKLRKVREAVIPHPSTEGVEVDDRLWSILRRALARAPDDRYASAAELEEELRAWMFESQHRAGRAEIAALVHDAFPDAARRNVEDLHLHQMVADVERLDARDRTSSAPSSPTAMSATGMSGSPLPGRLTVPVGARKQVVVLIVDVDGLTDLSERIEPEILAKRHYQLLRWTRSVVDRYGGHLQQAVDDHMTILFGVPRTRSDDVPKALECALELVRTVGQLRMKRMALQLCIGVHTGEVTVSRGRNRRIRYVARGNTTRLARRLSAVADHAQVVCSERVLSAAEGEFGFARGPDVPNRGGTAPTPGYTVQGRTRGLRARASGPWLRRGDELEVIGTALLELGSGSGRAVALSGDLGSGKSRLVREIRDLARKRGLPFYGARCTALGGEDPLDPYRSLILAIIGVEEPVRPAAVPAAVGRLVQLGLTVRERDAVSALLGADVPFAPERDEIARATRHILDALGREGALIVALDDIHDLSRDERSVLLRLLRPTVPSGVLLLLTHSGPLPEALATACREVSLAALDPEQQRRMLRQILDVSAVEEGVVDLVARTCEGNPLYLEEMGKYLLDGGRIEIQDGVARLAEDTTAELPHSLAALVSARLDALEPASKGALQLAAVIGPEFSRELLAEAAGLDDPTPLIADLASHGLLTRDRDTGAWSFASELVREAALRGILGVQRADYHRLVALAIETLYSGQLDGWSEALLGHCAKGGRLVDAARYAYAAGEEAERRQYLERAAALYRRGLQCLAEADRNPDEWDARVQGEAMLHFRSGVVSLLRGDTKVGERSLQVALDVASEFGLPWIEVRAHLELGRSYAERGRRALAKAHLGQARALLRVESDAELELQAAEAEAGLAFDDGRNAEAEALWGQALALAEGDPAAIARCELGLANRHIRNGQHDAASPRLERALEHARSANDRILEGRVLNNMGLLHSWRGDHDGALVYYRKALQVREGIGYTRGVAVNHHNVGDAHFQKGDRAKAWVAFTRSRELAVEMGWARGVVLNEVYLAYLDASRRGGEVAPVLEATERARALGDSEISTAGAWLAARLLVETGREEEARVQLHAALSEARQFGLRPMIGLLEEMLAAVGPASKVPKAAPARA